MEPIFWPDACWCLPGSYPDSSLRWGPIPLSYLVSTVGSWAYGLLQIQHVPAWPLNTLVSETRRSPFDVPCRTRLWYSYSFLAYLHEVETILPGKSLLLCIVKPVSRDCCSIPGPETAVEDLVLHGIILVTFRITALKIKIDVNNRRN